MTPAWTTRAEAAQYLRVTPKTIDRYVQQGLLTKFSIAGGRSTRFKVSELDALLQPEIGEAREKCSEARPDEEHTSTQTV